MTFSLFRSQSELCRVNAAQAEVQVVSPLFAATLETALAAAADTDGLVDPTLGSPGEVRLMRRFLRRPPGLALDLNGIVKALAVDESAALITAEGFVSAGGDIAVRGPVDVALPGGGAVRVTVGGLATSGISSRGRHLIDPLTGHPSESPWEQVTASGATCLAADVAAKAAFLLGERGPGWLDERGIGGRFVSLRGEIVENGCWSRALQVPACTLTSSPAIWYAARASGVAAYVALSIVVSLGLGLGGKAQNRRWPRFSLEDVHRFGGLLVGSLIGVHVLTIAADSFLPFSLTQLLVPFAAAYRPLWTGLGIAAAELLLALAITNHYRRRLPHRFWRTAHYLNFAVWTLASLHGLMAGTDRGAWWLALIYGVAVSTVLVLILWRFGGLVLRSPRVATAGAVGGRRLAALHHRAATTLASTLGRDACQREADGQVIRNGTNLEQIVSFVGQAERPEKLLVRADLLASSQSVESTSLQLEYLPSGHICRGRVLRSAARASAAAPAAERERRTINASWAPSEQGRGVIGRSGSAEPSASSSQPSWCRWCEAKKCTHGCAYRIVAAAMTAPTTIVAATASRRIPVPGTTASGGTARRRQSALTSCGIARRWASTWSAVMTSQTMNDALCSPTTKPARGPRASSATPVAKTARVDATTRGAISRSGSSGGPRRT